jgi:hypothetical protein
MRRNPAAAGADASFSSFCRGKRTNEPRDGAGGKVGDLANRPTDWRPSPKARERRKGDIFFLPVVKGGKNFAFGKKNHWKVLSLRPSCDLKLLAAIRMWTIAAAGQIRPLKCMERLRTATAGAAGSRRPRREERRHSGRGRKMKSGARAKWEEGDRGGRKTSG